jgi:dipeptidase E
MTRIYLLGGENVRLRSAKEVNEQAFEAAGGRPEVLVFPWARPSFDKNYQKRKLLNDYLRSLGAGHVDFVDYSESKEVIESKMAISDIIYLTGGQPSILIERLQKTGVSQLIEKYQGVIVGRSAGALAVCKRCVSTCRINKKVRIVEGLGIVDITLKVHHISSDDEILKTFSLKEVIYGVPAMSALICDNGILSAIGKVCVFRNGEQLDFKNYMNTRKRA